MPIQIHEEDDGKILAFHISGKLVREEYEQFASEFERLFHEQGKVRLLFNMTGLTGWDAGTMWEDTKFYLKHSGDIERIAMVGDNKWQHVMATISKPFLRASIRYFDQADVATAQKWLVEA